MLPANLALATISDSWPIFEFVLDQAKKPLPDKTETLAALGQIDRERRPLFAYFMADAIAASSLPTSTSVGQWIAPSDDREAPLAFGASRHQLTFLHL